MTTATKFVVDSKGRAVIAKDPDAILDYTLDWTDYMALIAPDTIASLTVTASNTVPTITVDSSDLSGDQTTGWISGGDVGNLEAFTFHIITAGGREDDRTLYVKIKEK